MFGTDKYSLVSTLKKIREKICAYMPGVPCDCKYTDNPNLARGPSEGTGCCEVRLAARIIESMTEEEYEEFMKRVW